MRRFEQVIGVIASMWGIVVLLFFLFGPVYQTAMSTSQGQQGTGTASGT
jgi:uncharacterized membrane protein